MKKNLVIFSISFFFIIESCKPVLLEQDELFSGHAEQVDTRSVQIAPMGSADVSSWYFQGIIDSVSVGNTSDSVKVSALLNNDPWTLSLTIPYPHSFPGKLILAKGDTVSVVGTKWSGGYESGWLYSITAKN